MRFKKRLTTILMLLMTAFMFLCGSGFTATGSAELEHSGKGEAVLSVTSDKDRTEFGKIVDEYLRQYRYINGAELIDLEGIKKTNDGYDVYVTFRRIDKVEGMGSFELKSLNEYTIEGSKYKKNLTYWAGQDYETTKRVYFDSLAQKVWLDSYTFTWDYLCAPKRADGTEFNAENAEGETDAEKIVNAFCDEVKGVDDNVMILTLQTFCSAAVSSVEVTLPGKISYYAGDAISLKDENTFTITPVMMNAKVAKSQIDETTGTASDGEEEETNNAIWNLSKVSTAIGYVVYDRGTSPAVIVLIVIGVVLALALLVLIVYKLYRAGERRIVRLEGQPDIWAEEASVKEDEIQNEGGDNVGE